MATTYIKPTGQGGDYTTLSAWEAGQQGVLAAPEIGIIDGDWSATTDTTAVTIDGWTTSEANYISVYCASSALHNGKWNTVKYRLQIYGQNAILIKENFIRLEGLQVANTDDRQGGYCIQFYDNTAGGDVRISKCILKRTQTYAGSYGFLISWTSTATVKIWNNIIYDIVGRGISGEGNETVYAYNNTIHSCSTGLYRSNSTFVAKNNLVKGCTDSYNGTFSVGTDYNATDTADDIGQGTHNKVSQTFTFVDEAGDDFHLASNDAGAKDSGIDLSGDTYLPFSTDIDGQTRSGSWDIGADEYVSGSSPSASESASPSSSLSASPSASESASPSASESASPSPSASPSASESASPSASASASLSSSPSSSASASPSASESASPSSSPDAITEIIELQSALTQGITVTSSITKSLQLQSGITKIIQRQSSLELENIYG